MTALREAEFQSQVIDLAHLYGWTVAHFRPARTEHGWATPVQADGAGFPDLVLVREGAGELIFAELKAEKGRLRADQKRWGELLLSVGAEFYVWRPSDFDDIHDRLRHVASVAAAA